MAKIDLRKEADALKKEWKSARFSGITRPYSAEDVLKLRGSMKVEYTVALSIFSPRRVRMNNTGFDCVQRPSNRWL